MSSSGSRQRPQRKSLPAAVARQASNKPHSSSSVPKRRQTLAGSGNNNSNNKENPNGDPHRAATASPSQKTVNLGSASSYYFSGAPPTPVQQLVQERLYNDGGLESSFSTEQQTMTKDHTGTMSMRSNTSYLSSSSDESTLSDALNLTTVSDTTELTAGNFVTLAATTRPPRGNNNNNRRQTLANLPTTTTTAANAASAVLKQQKQLPIKRRQTMEPVLKQQQQPSKRRQTMEPSMTTQQPPPQPNNTEQVHKDDDNNNNNTSERTLSKEDMTKLLHLSVLGNAASNPRLSLQSTFEERQQQEGNDGDKNKGGGDDTTTMLDLRDILPPSQPDDTMQESTAEDETETLDLASILPPSLQSPQAFTNDDTTIESQQLANQSGIHSQATSNDTTQYDLQAILTQRPRYSESNHTTAVQMPLPPSSKLTKNNQFASDNDESEKEEEKAPVEKPPKSPARRRRKSEQLDDSSVVITDMAASPARSTRSSTKKQKPLDNDTHSVATLSSPARSSSKEKTVVAAESPARNTRSTKEITATVESPASNTRSTKETAPMTESPAGSTKETVAMADSPARNTHSSSKLKAPEQDTTPIMGNMAASPARSTRSHTNKQAAVESPVHTNTALSPPRSGRSTQKQVQASSPVITDMALSPARSTRSRTKAMSESADSLSHQNDDTTESLGELFKDLPPSELDAAVNSDNSMENTTDSVGDSIAELFSSIYVVSGNAQPSSSDKETVDETSTLSTIDNAQDIAALSEPKEVAVSQQSRGSIDISHPASKEGALDTSTFSFGSLFVPAATNKNPSQRPSMTSDISVGGLFRDSPDPGTQITTAEARANVPTQAAEPSKVDSPRDYDSIGAGSSISLPSAITTPAGMSGNVSRSDVENGASQSGPPSAIQFRTEPVGTSPFTVGKSPLRKGLTPTKLSPTPRRFLLNKSRTPLSKQSLTPSKLPPSPMQLANPTMLSRMGPLSHSKPRSARRLPPSPLRRPGNDKRSNDASEQSIESSAAKRQKAFQHLQGFAARPSDTDATAKVSVHQPHDSLQSALRRPGSVRPKSTRKVAFSSPSAVEFNLGSPSTRLTPMPKWRFSQNTTELEQDTASPLGGGMSRHAGSTPFHKRLLSSDDSSMEISHDSSVVTGEDGTVELEETVEQVLPSLSNNDMSNDDMSVDTTDGETLPDQEHTVALEENMTAVLCGGNASFDQDSTVALEENMTAVLGHVPTHGQTADLVVPSSGSKNNSQATMPLEEEPTVEIETDMNALLNSDDDDDTSLVEASTSIELRSARLSVSSRRFSVEPASRFSVSNTDISVEGRPVPLQEESLLQSPSLRESEQPKPELDLKVGEVVDAIQNCAPKLDIPNEYLSRVCESVREFDVSDTMNALVAGVLDTINSTSVGDLDPSSVVDVSDQKKEAFLELQGALRSSDSDVQKQLGLLVEAFRTCDMFDWMTWLVSASEHLEQPLEAKCIAIDDEMNRLDEMCNDIERSLALVDRQARRKSISRREALIAGAEKEIQQLQKLVADTKNRNSALSEELNSTNTMVATIEENLSLTTKTKEEEPRAESAEQNYSSLRGLTKWKPHSLTDTEYVFHYLGQVPQASIVITFDIRGQGSPVACRCALDDTLFKRHGKRKSKQFASVNGFLEKGAEELCATTSTTLSTPSLICHTLQQLEWRLCRMESTAMELIALQKRYQIFLSPNPSPVASKFLVEAEFSGNNTKDAVLRATFELSEQYPFGSLDMNMEAFENDLDVDRLRELLVKNAKPGFGHLSRICDVINASLSPFPLLA